MDRKWFQPLGGIVEQDRSRHLNELQWCATHVFQFIPTVLKILFAFFDWLAMDTQFLVLKVLWSKNNFSRVTRNCTDGLFLASQYHLNFKSYTPFSVGRSIRLVLVLCYSLFCKFNPEKVQLPEFCTCLFHVLPRCTLEPSVAPRYFGKLTNWKLSFPP
jgi:hypothetical protein